MKYIILALLPFFLVPIEIQERGVWKIIVTNSNNAELNHRFVIEKLINLDYNINKQDDKMFTIRTEIRKLPKTSGSYILNVRCTGNQIIVTGELKSGVEIEMYGAMAGDDFEPIVNKGMNGSIYKVAFNEMNKVALNFGDQISYSK